MGFLDPKYCASMITEETVLHPPPGYPCLSFELPCFLLKSPSHTLKPFGLNGAPFYERLVTIIKASDAKDMEGPFCDYIGSQYKKPMLLAGPILLEPPKSSDDHCLEERWAEWLGKFKEGSIVYCAFGSECKLEKNQFQELVLGLELTRLSFLAPLKPTLGFEIVEEALPDGFKESVGERGHVHGGLVQQQLILKHSSVGCFVNHGGYGSMWEALVSDSQMVMVPQIRNQFLNTYLLSQELRVSVEVERREEDGWYTREGVCSAVKLVMDKGSQVRDELKSNHAKWRGILLREGFETSYFDDFMLKVEGLMMS